MVLTDAWEAAWSRVGPQWSRGQAMIPDELVVPAAA